MLASFLTSFQPDHGIVLTGGMRDDSSLIPAFQMKSSLPLLIAAYVSHYHLLLWKVLFGIRRSVLLRC